MYKETRAQSQSDSNPALPASACLVQTRKEFGESLKQWLRAGDFTQKQTQASCFPMSHRGDLREVIPLA